MTAKKKYRVEVIDKQETFHGYEDVDAAFYMDKLLQIRRGDNWYYFHQDVIDRASIVRVEDD